MGKKCRETFASRKYNLSSFPVINLSVVLIQLTHKFKGQKMIEMQALTANLSVF